METLLRWVSESNVLTIISIKLLADKINIAELSKFRQRIEPWKSFTFAWAMSTQVTPKEKKLILFKDLTVTRCIYHSYFRRCFVCSVFRDTDKSSLSSCKIRSARLTDIQQQNGGRKVEMMALRQQGFIYTKRVYFRILNIQNDVCLMVENLSLDKRERLRINVLGFWINWLEFFVEKLRWRLMSFLHWWLRFNLNQITEISIIY